MNLLDGKKIRLGTCYYPEHWDKELWESDLLRMKEVGIEVIRIAEFAWSKIELNEGEFDFSFFDEFLELTKKVGMKVIFCTPTATPPAWLTDKYPEVLNARQDGVLFRHGMRRHYNYNSKKYLELSAIIVEEIAKHYAKHESIIGWQLDNEFNCEHWEFYSESDTLRFREFLKDKYKTLDKLNKAWGTTFWNQTYTSWKQIYVPRTTAWGNNNPHHLLDYKRFISDSVCRYAKMQSDILKKYIKPNDFITTNSIFGNLDCCRMTEESLDFITYDSYPNFGYCLNDYENIKTDLNDRKWSRNLMEARAISKIFGIMEQQSGSTGNHISMEGPSPRPGQITLWTMQSIAHGADYISYFRWRTCTMGSEIYWHGILDYSGRDNARLMEVSNVNKKLTSMTDVAGSYYKADICLLKEYDNVWDSELDVWHGRIEWFSQMSWFRATQQSHTPMDFGYIEHMTSSDLQKYKVLVYPHAVILKEETMAKLEEYVANGGILIMGCRTGYKDTTGQCVMLKLPGLASNLCGTDIPEYSYVAPDDNTPYAMWNGRKLNMSIFNDRLSPILDGKVEAVYEDAYYAGTPALISKEYKKGKTYYFGAAFDDETVLQFLEELQLATPYRDIIELPKSCEIAVREKNNVKYLFVLNYSKESVTIKLNRELESLYDEDGNNNVIESGNITLQGYGTKVYKIV